MPGKLALAGRNKILDRGIKIAEANLPSWLTELALGTTYAAKEATAAALAEKSDTGHRHANATAAEDGFMAAADKSKLDAATDQAVGGTVVARNGAGDIDVRNVFATVAPTLTGHLTRKDYVDNKVAAVTYGTLGTVPTSSLPPLAINETFPVANQAAMLALTAQRGDMAIRSDNGRTYVLATDSPSTLADWKEIMAAGQVQSVAGKTGVVALAKGDVGLANVDNTSDVNKPASTAQKALFVPKWVSGTVYASGDQVVTPSNMVMTANAAHTASAAFSTDIAKWNGATNGVPYGHMGRTQGFIALSGAVTTIVMAAAQELRGGMTFDAANSALVVPVTGRYRVHLKGFFSGNASGVNQTNITVNGSTPSGVFQKVGSAASKMDGNDISAHSTGVIPLNAGDKVQLIQFSGSSAWGSNGYDGSFLEIEYVGGP